ncbi:hypothetical protein [Fulvimarina sp. MAC3]|uniref:hypothetical protein n=1 Tax=Fulvimarina sp. MAC3 TaxID=3148887 RepID=UPI0031FCF265
MAKCANLFVNFVPIFGAILAVLILGEVLRGHHIAVLSFVIEVILLEEQGMDRILRS